MQGGRSEKIKQGLKTPYFVILILGLCFNLYAQNAVEGMLSRHQVYEYDAKKFMFIPYKFTEKTVKPSYPQAHINQKSYILELKDGRKLYLPMQFCSYYQEIQLCPCDVFSELSQEELEAQARKRSRQFMLLDQYLDENDNKLYMAFEDASPLFYDAMNNSQSFKDFFAYPKNYFYIKVGSDIIRLDGCLWIGNSSCQVLSNFVDELYEYDKGIIRP
ncbi:hypothetical protein MRY82_06255 [bacterium]|nr:hypothetical protein [bacterium]